MNIEIYDELEWEIDTLPIGSSTPDELFEYSYRAYSKCPHCEEKIEGTANYWARNDDMIGAWLNSIDYDECDCQNEEKEEDYGEGEE